MLELSPATTAILVGAGLAGIVRLALLVVSVRRRRSVARRLATVAVRLDVPGAEESSQDEDTITRLERLAESAVLRVSDAEAQAGRMAGVLDELPQGVVICDEGGSALYRNAMAAAMAEFSAGDPETDETVAEVLGAALGGERRSCTVELQGPPQRSLTVSGRPLDDGRRSLGAVAVIEDVSERRRLELLRASFVDDVTAELRTPVGGLGLLAATLVAEKDPRVARGLAQRLRDDALRIGHIVDDLAELSRLGAEALPQRQLVPVHVVVAQAVEEVRSLASARSVVIDVVDAPRRLSLVGHRRQLVSAVRRLVENAVGFSEAGSTVRVAVRRDGRWVEIAVSDQGPGIPASELDRIFECFYRLDRGGQRDGAGTGLGLAIASQIAGGHGGVIEVSSTEDEGSTFTLRLPLGPRSRHARSGRKDRPRWRSAAKEVEPQPDASAAAR